MSIFNDPLPESYEFDGRIYPFQTDFREWIKFELLMTDTDIAPRDKAYTLQRIIFPEELPHDARLWDFILWFYACGKQQQNTKGTGKKTAAIYSFEYDDGYIYAAFEELYGIDLIDTPYLHWWKFKSLFRALHDCKFTEIMGYRAEEIDSKMPASRQARIKQLKEIYALPRSLSEQQKIAEAKRIMEQLRGGIKI